MPASRLRATAKIEKVTASIQTQTPYCVRNCPRLIPPKLGKNRNANPASASPNSIQTGSLRTVESISLTAPEEISGIVRLRLDRAPTQYPNNNSTDGDRPQCTRLVF